MKYYMQFDCYPDDCADSINDFVQDGWTFVQIVSNAAADPHTRFYLFFEREIVIPARTIEWAD